MTHILFDTGSKKFLNKKKGKPKFSIAKNLPKNWKREKEKHYWLRKRIFEHSQLF